MDGSLRDDIRVALGNSGRPLSREQVASLLPGRLPNSVNRMLRDMVERGAVVEERGLFSLKPPPASV